MKRKLLLKAVLMAALLGGLAYAYYYYRLHRPTSEAEIANIEALIVAGKGEEARALMIDAQTRSRDVDGLRLRIGRAFLHQGQVGPATALLSKVEGSLIKEERVAVAEYFLVAGDPFSATRFFEAALKTGMPRTPSLLGRYGEALALSANPEAAVAAFRESLTLDDSKPRVRLNLALTLANMNRLDEARVEAAAVLKVEPANQKAQALLTALGGSR
jgi:Flp pilus assembly protein TadD